MSISIGSNLLSTYTSSINATNKKDLENKLSNVSTENDAELMEVCKSFESYFVEQVFKALKKTVPESETNSGEYLDMFGDKLYEEYAAMATESQGFGIAKMLYESMKVK